MLCRPLHHILAAKFMATEIPEFLDDSDPSSIVMAIQLGSCPYEDTVAVNLTNSYIRVHFNLTSDDEFSAIGHVCRVVRMRGAPPRIIGQLNSQWSLGAYEIEVSVSGDVRGRGVMVRRPFMAGIFSSDRKITTPSPDKSDLVAFGEHLQMMRIAWEITKGGYIASWTIFDNRNG